MWDFIPEQASSIAPEIDRLYAVLITLSAAFAIPIVFLIIYFGVKYRRGSKADRSRPIAHHTGLELTWIVVPLILALGVFSWSAVLFFRMQRPPTGVLEMHAVGKQWMWKFQHPTGQREINTLHVPVGQPIKLTMISQDVIHSFYVPAFRVKMDVLPGRYTTVWFEATKAGEYHLFCAEYCGADHSRMIGSVIAMSPSDYEAWLATGGVQTGEAPGGSLAAQGEQLFQQLGCSGCHAMGGGGIGPSLAGIYGQPVPLQDGSTVIADDAYIRESIYNPNAKIVAGYQALMPSYQGQISEEQVLQLVEYIKSLGNADGSAAEESTPEPAAPQATATP